MRKKKFEKELALAIAFSFCGSSVVPLMAHAQIAGNCKNEDQHWSMERRMCVDEDVCDTGFHYEQSLNKCVRNEYGGALVNESDKRMNIKHFSFGQATTLRTKGGFFANTGCDFVDAPWDASEKLSVCGNKGDSFDKAEKLAIERASKARELKISEVPIISDMTEGIDKITAEMIRDVGLANQTRWDSTDACSIPDPSVDGSGQPKTIKNAKNPTVVIIGDSSQSNGSQSYENGWKTGSYEYKGTKTAWPEVLRQRGYNIINRAVGGNTLEAEAARFDRDVLSLNPDVVIIGGGGNDCWDGDKGVPDSAYEAQQEMVRKCWERGIYVIIASYEPDWFLDGDLINQLTLRHDQNGTAYWDSESHEGYTKAQREKLKENWAEMREKSKSFAEENHIPYIDTYALIKDKTATVDSVHEDQAAYNDIADGVAKELDKVLPCQGLTEQQIWKKELNKLKELSNGDEETFISEFDKDFKNSHSVLEGGKYSFSLLPDGSFVTYRYTEDGKYTRTTFSNSSDDPEDPQYLISSVNTYKLGEPDKVDWEQVRKMEIVNSLGHGQAWASDSANLIYAGDGKYLKWTQDKDGTIISQGLLSMKKLPSELSTDDTKGFINSGFEEFSSSSHDISTSFGRFKNTIYQMIKKNVSTDNPILKLFA
jgi:lysophospholipase L1-like esterase